MRTEFERNGFSVSGRLNVESGDYDDIECIAELDVMTMGLINRIVKMYAAEGQVVDVMTVIRRAIRIMHDEMLRRFEEA